MTPLRGVVARFELTPDGGPFPSDVFMVPDANQNTGRRVNMPYPDCSVQLSDCHDLNVINTLDGFGLQTRLSIPFDSPIDPTSVNSQNVFLIALESYLRRPSYQLPFCRRRHERGAAVYDASTGAEVGFYPLLLPGEQIVNDVVVTHDAAYFTVSTGPFLGRLALEPNGQPGTAETIPLPPNFGMESKRLRTVGQVKRRTQTGNGMPRSGKRERRRVSRVCASKCCTVEARRRPQATGNAATWDGK